VATAARARPPAEPATGSLLDRPVSSILGRSRPVARLAALDIHQVRDLLFHLPRRYDDFSRPMSLGSLREQPPEGPVSATVEIVSLDVQPGFRRRVQRTVARLRDETGEGEAVWFGRRYVERRLHAGMTVALAGKVELRGWLPRFANPEFGEVGADALHAGRIVPVYRLTEGVTLPWLRKAIRTALDRALPDYADYLAPAVLAQAAQEAFETDEQKAAARPLPAIADAIEWVHFPPDFGQLDDALSRLAFDELLALQLGMVSQARRRRGERSAPISVDDDRYPSALAMVERTIGAQIAERRRQAGMVANEMPTIRLTADQQAALASIRADLDAERPMMRLLQGDVGSGKTAVAALAMCFVADGGGQTALLAPTELLARQHAATLAALLTPLGHEVTLLTGSLEAAARRAALELISAPPAAGGVDRASLGRVVVGTHALVQEAVAFNDLRLVVVDEQHRFGVAEREALAGKGRAPHVLLMTATPIPRTLAQVMHADLAVSDLRTPPAGRLEIGTGVRNSGQLVSWLDRDGRRREGALPLLVRQLAAGRRAFVVVPRVEDDDASDARSVADAAELIADNWPAAAALVGAEPTLPPMAIVHGQQKASARDQQMERFRSGEAQIIVGTTVLEVGVDVPEATVMLILNADLFGLAQLHQLRGRVGRGEAQSYCVLVSDRYPREGEEPASDEEAVAAARLDALAANHDGFRLAELDLEQRREGNLLGLHQSGLPPLRVATLARPAHLRLSLHARRLAEEMIDERGRLAVANAALEHELAGGWLKRVGAGEIVGVGETVGATEDG
jgi:ATP-dependent DNA helicase RecG